MKKVFIVLALCLCALPAMQARSLTEEELLESTALLLESSTALTSEEQMLLASGTYGNSPMGSYGGLLEDGGLLVDEAGNVLNQESSTSTTSPSDSTSGTTSATTNTQAKAAASAAIPADKSAALLVAGMMVAVSAFLL